MRRKLSAVAALLVAAALLGACGDDRNHNKQFGTQSPKTTSTSK